MEQITKKFNDRLIDIVIGSMLMTVAGIMPLVVRFVLLPFPSELLHLIQSKNYYDVFSYWKSWFLIVPALIIIIFCVSEWVYNRRILDLKKIFEKPPVIISLIYLIFVILSALASPYTYTSWFGTFYRNEGAIVWLAYFTVFFSSIYFAGKPEYVKFILYSLIFSSTVMGIIGVGQFIGLDFFNTDFARWLITTGTPATDIEPVFNTSHGLLIHPNTFGKYSAMLCPIFFLAALVYNGKKYVNLLFFTAGSLMLLCIVGSRSLGGLAGIFTAIVVLTGTCIYSLVYNRKQKSNAAVWKLINKYLVFLIFGTCISMLLLFLFVPHFNNRIVYMFSRLKNVFQNEKVIRQNYYFFDNKMSVFHGDKKLFSLTVNNLNSHDWLTILDGSGQEIQFYKKNENFSKLLSNMQHPVSYLVDIPEYKVITITKYPQHFTYSYNDSVRPLLLTLQDGCIFGISLNGDLINLSDNITTWGFNGFETWGSNRGYIWSRSIPLMPSHFFIGSGSDTFPSVFPQQDIIGKFRFFNNPYIIIDLSQNLFLRTWLTTGGISAIALFILFGHYILSTFWSLVKAKNESMFSFGLRLGILAGICAFCISSMTTDSTNGSTGIFFILLGLGYGMNFYVTDAQKQLD